MLTVLHVSIFSKYRRKQILKNTFELMTKYGFTKIIVCVLLQAFSADKYSSTSHILTVFQFTSIPYHLKANFLKTLISFHTSEHLSHSK